MHLSPQGWQTFVSAIARIRRKKKRELHKLTDAVVFVEHWVHWASEQKNKDKKNPPCQNGKGETNRSLCQIAYYKEIQRVDRGQPKLNLAFFYLVYLYCSSIFAIQSHHRAPSSIMRACRPPESSPSQHLSRMAM